MNMIETFKQLKIQWKIGISILVVGFVLGLCGYFYSCYTQNRDEDGETVPQHDVETDVNYADAMPEEGAKHEPIRKGSTVSKGDTFLEIMEENGISHKQAYDIHKAVKEVFDLAKMIPGHEFILVFSPDNQDLIGLEYKISDFDNLIVTINSGGITASKHQAQRILESANAGPLKQMDFTVEKGDNIFTILQKCGVGNYQIDALSKTIKKEYNLADIVPGHTLSVWINGETPPKLARLSYEIDSVTILDIEPDSGAFKAKKRTLDVEVRYERAVGTITSSLYESATQGGVSPEVVMALSDVFAWDINFFTDIRDGDTYTVLYEKYFVQGEFKGYGRVIAARFINQGDEHLAIYYENSEGSKGYYDGRGNAIRKMFLKAPLNYRRISSGFTYNRMHPIFHVERPHLGVDYAAPSGTPIVSLGDGRVIFRGWANGFGNTVRIKHPEGYASYYGHLSKFARGINKGSQVNQGEVIGYVGKTGFSTGPHLDFRVSINGKFINPLKLKSVTGSPLRGAALADFKVLSVKRLSMLDDASLNIALNINNK